MLVTCVFVRPLTWCFAQCDCRGDRCDSCPATTVLPSITRI